MQSFEDPQKHSVCKFDFLKMRLSLTIMRLDLISELICDVISYKKTKLSVLNTFYTYELNYTN